MMRTFRTTLAVAAILAIIFCAVLLCRKTVGRIRRDLTEHRHYTLSKGTHNVLGKLNQQVTLKFYFSRTAALKLPEGVRPYIDYALYVRDLLEEYADLSGGKLTLTVIDPARFSDEEEQAINYGVKALPLPSEDYFFFGLVATTELGNEKVIEIFAPDREEFVEYEISKLITDVTRRSKKKIGVISSLQVLGSGTSPYMMQMMPQQQSQQPWIIMRHLREQYEVESIDKEARDISEEIDFLMVIHPKDLPEHTLFAIDQYVMKGGKLLVFVDPHCWADQPKRDPRNPYAAASHKSSSDLNRLLKGWSVKMAPDRIVVDRSLALKQGKTREGRMAPLLPFLGLTEKCVNKKEVITAQLHDLSFIYGGALKPVAGAETTVTSLLTTTDIGTTWKPASPYELTSVEAIGRSVIDGTEPLMLACSISGELQTNFPDGIEAEAQPNAPDKDADKDDADEKAEEKKPARLAAIKEADAEALVLVFADVDMIADQFAYQQNRMFGIVETVRENAPLVFNALEYLSGTEDLIAIRSRGRFKRPFEVIEKLEEEIAEETRKEQELLNAEIEKYEQQLQGLLSGATKGDTQKLEDFAAQQENLKTQLRKARKRLRQLKAAKLKNIESLKSSLEIRNVLVAPALVLLVAIILALIRFFRARHYAPRRTPQ